MTPDLLASAGAALYGARWQTQLADALGVSLRTMQRWAAGAGPIPPGVAEDLRRLVSERQGALEALAARLVSEVIPA